MDTENIDRLFLELSQFTQATTGKELLLKKQMTSQQSTITALVEALEAAESFIVDGGMSEVQPGSDVVAQIHAALSKAQREGEG